MRHRFLCFVLITAAACAAGCARHVDVTTVLTQDNCSSAETGVHLIDFATLATFRGTHLIGMTESPDAAAHPAHLIAIVPAQYPTAGYSVELKGDAIRAKTLLTINVDIKRPPEGAVLAQMITRPCLVVDFNNPAVHRVRVLHDADVLGEVDLPASR